MSRFATRPARADDYAALRDVYVAAVRGLAIQRYSAAQCEAWAAQVLGNADWAARLAALKVLIAETAGDDRRIAGFLAYADDGHIDLLFTAPDCARSGVASLLYAQAEAALRTCGATRLYTEASRLAQPFFAKQGFRIDAEESVMRNGEALQRFAMSKQL